MKEFLAGVVGVVEANSFETFSLWGEYKDSWEASNGGTMVTVGEINGDPICISLIVNVVCGKRILFYYATSQVVDYRIVDKWLNDNMPDSAFRNSTREQLKSTDATNFHNILH